MRLLVTLVAATMIIGACSSTNEQATVTGETKDSSSATGRLTNPSASSGAAAAGDGRAGSLDRGTGREVTRERTGPEVPSSGSTAPVSSRGGTIKIGFHYSENLDAAYRAFGASGEFVDVPVAINKLVAWINRNGGLGGRKVIAAIHGTDPLNGTFPAQAERACTFFAEDAKVSFVVSGAVLPDDNMPACHAKRNLPLVWSYHYLLNRQAFERYANHLYMPQMIGTYRFGFYIDALASAGFFDRDARIGVVRYDQPVHKEFLDTVVKPGLAKRGLKLTAEAAITQPHSAGEAGDSASQVSNAILRFRSSEVSHVLFVPSGGAIPLLWGAATDSQSYYPRLAFNSLDIGNFVTDNMNERHLERAVYIGWMPAGDTYMQHVPKGDVDLERCKVATGIRNDTDMVRFCDGIFFLKAVFDRTPRFDVAGLRAGVEALGTGFGSPWSLATKFAPGRHDGASSYRLMRYYADCGCFKYVGAERAIP